MLRPAQAGSEGDNFFENIVLETPLESLDGVPTGNGTENQIVDAGAQWVLTGRETWNKTVIANDFSSQASCIFVARELLGQSNKININPDQQIINMIDKNLQGQASKDQCQHKGSLAAVPPLPKDCNSEKEFWLLMEEKKRTWLEIKIQKLKKEKEWGWASDKDFMGHSYHNNDPFHHQVTVKKACQAPDPTFYTKTLQ